MGRGMVHGPGGVNVTETEQGARLCAGCVWQCRGRAPRPRALPVRVVGERGGHAAAVGMALEHVETGKQECPRRV